jgi:vesicle coat complex subunit
VNSKGIQEATNVLKGMFAQTNASFESHKKSLTSYDSFLDGISNANLISDESTEANITSSLYTPSSRLTALLKKSEHPMKSYFDLQEKLTYGFVNALETHDPSELNM